MSARTDLPSMATQGVEIPVITAPAAHNSKVAAAVARKVGQDESFSDESSGGILEVWDDAGGPSKGASRPGLDSSSPSKIPIKTSTTARQDASDHLQSISDASSGESVNLRKGGCVAPDKLSYNGGPTPKPMPSAVPVASSRPATQTQFMVSTQMAPYSFPTQLTGGVSMIVPPVAATQSFQPPMFTPQWHPRQLPNNFGSQAYLPVWQGPNSTFGQVGSNYLNRATSHAAPHAVVSQSEDRSRSTTENAYQPAIPPPHLLPSQNPDAVKPSQPNFPGSLGSSSTADPMADSLLNRPVSHIPVPPVGPSMSVKGVNDDHNTPNAAPSTRNLSQAPSSPHSPSAALRYPPTLGSSTLTSKIPDDKSEFSNPEPDKHPGSKAVVVPQSSKSEAKIDSTHLPNPQRQAEHGAWVEEVCEWRFPAKTIEMSVQEGLRHGKDAPVVYERCGLIRTKPKKNGRSLATRSSTRALGANKRAKVVRNESRVIAAEFDKRYLQYDVDSYGSINVLVRTGAILAKHELFLNHLQQLPESVPESDSASSIGRKYQARIPHLRSDQELKNEEDPLLPG